MSKSSLEPLRRGHRLLKPEQPRDASKRIGHKVFLESLPPEMRLPADVIARKIEATFGVRALPHEIAQTPIPLIVNWKEPPDTPLFHALFTSEPEGVA